MSIMDPFDKVEILLLSGLFLSLVSMVFFVLYLAISSLLMGFQVSRSIRYLGAAIPTLIFAALTLLLIDNFTYTVFKFGIVTSTGTWRGAYALLFIFLLIVIYIQVIKFLGLWSKDIPGEQLSKLPYYFLVGIFILSTALALITFDFGKFASSNATSESLTASRHPNIILLGGDGLSAEHLSVYGYERDTTPMIRELAKTSLLAENAFANANGSTGSVISMLTGKLPTQTGVIYSPNILSGENSYQHLPGILKKEGYLAIEYGVPHFVDSYNANMLVGFDMVNGRTEETRKLNVYLQNLGYTGVAYFLNELTERITERLRHIFFFQDMQNPYLLVTQSGADVRDEEKVSQMLDAIDQSEEPVFVHAHLMGTHNAAFVSPIQVFSNGEQQDEAWRVDLYDDAILSFDSYVAQVIDRLKANGEYENTILIIYSDHPITYWANQRIPLIFHFPAGQYAGEISQNAQNLDIAPTILDYLGLPVPTWMSGKSLLEIGSDEQRLIFSMDHVNATEEQPGTFSLDPQQIKPPFYQFRSVTIMDCQRWYLIDLTTFIWDSGDVPNYVNPCKDDDLLSFDEIQRRVKNRLIQDGFDVSSLP
jgi:arylsulfatase A-like enzyme